MAEEFNIIIEHLRTIRSDIGNINQKLAIMQEDMHGMKMHIAALVSAEARQDGELAHMRSRLERIETRLDIVDHEPH